MKVIATAKIIAARTKLRDPVPLLVPMLLLLASGAETPLCARRHEGLAQGRRLVQGIPDRGLKPESLTRSLRARAPLPDRVCNHG
jgi:hypothetical protein